MKDEAGVKASRQREAEYLESACEEHCKQDAQQFGRHVQGGSSGAASGNRIRKASQGMLEKAECEHWSG